MYEFWWEWAAAPREFIMLWLTGDWHILAKPLPLTGDDLRIINEQMQQNENMQQMQNDQVHQIEQLRQTLQSDSTIKEEQLSQSLYSIDNVAFNYLSSVPSLFRLVMAIVFVGSFLLRPLIMRPISLVWARIIESEKPVFTLTFAGAAAFASAIAEAAKHL
jgi:hypothetical protein